MDYELTILREFGYISASEIVVDDTSYKKSISCSHCEHVVDDHLLSDCLVDDCSCKKLVFYRGE